MSVWKQASPRGKRMITIAAVFVFAVFLTVIGTLTPISSEDANSINQDLNSTVNSLADNGALLPYIFGNNLMISLIMFIPFIGPIIGGYVLYNTGTVIAAEGIAQGFQPTAGFLLLFLTPVAWLEFIAYSVAIAGSIWLSIRISQGRFRHEIVHATEFIAVVAVILLISAAIETLIITA